MGEIETAATKEKLCDVLTSHCGIPIKWQAW